MTGKLYGIGVSIGDPELLTVKAVRILEEADVIAIPKEEKENCLAWKNTIALIPQLSDKDTLYVPMPMTKDRDLLEQSHTHGAELIKEQLKKGNDVAFLTIGDPCVYATYMYVHKKVSEAGFDTQIINGVTSFCAAAAAMNMALCEEEQELHIIPSSYGVEKALDYPGVKVLMKSGSHLPDVIRALQTKVKENSLEVYMAENCGMKDEKLYKSLEEISVKDMNELSYYTTIIVKEKKYD